MPMLNKIISTSIPANIAKCRDYVGNNPTLNRNYFWYAGAASHLLRLPLSLCMQSHVIGSRRTSTSISFSVLVAVRCSSRANLICSQWIKTIPSIAAAHGCSGYVARDDVWHVGVVEQLPVCQRL